MFVSTERITSLKLQDSETITLVDMQLYEIRCYLSLRSNASVREIGCVAIDCMARERGAQCSGCTRQDVSRVISRR